MNSVIVQTAIGLILVFAIFAVFVSVLTEALTRFIGLRSEFLLRGIRTLVDGGGTFSMKPFTDWFRLTDGTPDQANTDAVVTDILKHPLVAGSATDAAALPKAGKAPLSARSRRALPSYVSGRAFATALVDLTIPDAKGRTTLSGLPDKIKAIPDDGPLRHVKAALLSLTTGVGDDVEKFRDNVAHWYDAHMDRVSGWYKRYVRWISIGLGAVLVLLFNLNVLSIARELYTDQGVRTAVVAQAAGAANCTSSNTTQCLSKVQSELATAETAGLPIGWRVVPSCAPGGCSVPERYGLLDHGRSAGHNVVTFLLVLAGWLLMVIALLPGARFWFDILGRLGSLRSTGPKPATTPAPA